MVPVLVDENVTKRLEKYLKDCGMKTVIVSVNQLENLRGKSDAFLQGYAAGLEAVFEEPTVLITKDVEFHAEYFAHRPLKMYYHRPITWYKATKMYKIFKHGKGFHHIYRQLLDWGYR